ncbi:thioredoxin-like protein [Microdochium trichocladiopsis]|uniref:Thioredoxin-like protein n=1 Tax=Microdochium trichocladiopsis TaxID=1682393 RepID=A0A9P8XWX6_9PEZI|nr:thioredoxin-like protein [Microdochium trichocladiopsis]KAH7017997.1 thioredoxin-like protein [Microdochium trichocladiopsis]
MPLIDAAAPPALDEQGAQYVVFFASGQPSWCPDCRDALPALQAVFGGQDAPTAHLVRAGERPEWRDPKNKYRTQPWGITCLPTVVRYESGKEVARLGDVESQQESALRKLIK